VFIDTAGFDDEGELGSMRIARTRTAGERTDIALIVFSGDVTDREKAWAADFRKSGTPVVAVVNKSDVLEDAGDIVMKIKAELDLDAILVSAKEKTGISDLVREIIRMLPQEYEAPSITGGLAKDGDVVVLVMPQDIQAPKNRLILPQVQTIRELLDRKCIVVSVTTDRLKDALSALSAPPALIVTDSQVFREVYDLKPEGTRLTSFSVLFASYKGDIAYFREGAGHIERLSGTSRVLIAEACTHAPLTEDIGREKIPKMLRARYGEALGIDIVSGTDFPEDVTGYDLIIHCGACMFNRKHVLSRVEKAKVQKVPMTNYGVALAFLSGILDRIDMV
jgi:[FeFe] hydrogenase H-cluster maturation GTPase HydF